MCDLKGVNRLFKESEELSFNNSSKIILMSDCHRGDENWADDFARNQNIYFASLTKYYEEGYTYIELGDGDELWKNKKMNNIENAHSHIFWLLKKFHDDNRLFVIYGNHDIVKRNVKFVRDNMYSYFSVREKRRIELFKDIRVHEGLLLRCEETGKKILLIHGHQGDFLNERLWWLSRFLVRYLLRPLQSVGVEDPTSPAVNFKKSESTERRLKKWAEETGEMIIAGHNHRPYLSDIGESGYFNTGSSVHPRCITGIELVKGELTLVKWSNMTREDGTLFIGREVLAGPRGINN